jgi:hypothetical protein
MHEEATGACGTVNQVKDNSGGWVWYNAVSSIGLNVILGENTSNRRVPYYTNILNTMDIFF